MRLASGYAGYRHSACFALLVAVGCATATTEEPLPDEGGGGGSGGASGSAGSALTGGTSFGGTSSGGTSSGGTASGGTASGGTASGGTASGAGGAAGAAMGGSAGQGGAAGGAGGKGGAGPFGGAAGMTGGSAGKAGAGAGGAGGAGGSAAGKGGTSAGTGGATAGSGGSGSGPCPTTRPAAGKGSSGDIMGTAAACFRITDNVAGWGCSNMQARSVSVNGVELKTAAEADSGCGDIPLPARIDGAYYFQVGAGGVPFASFYWWCSGGDCPPPT